LAKENVLGNEPLSSTPASYVSPSPPIATAVVALSALVACDEFVALSALTAWLALVADGTVPSVATLMMRALLPRSG